jgi:hypothetical protein
MLMVIGSVVDAVIGGVIGLAGGIIVTLLGDWLRRRKISDREAFALLLEAFDRPAFKGMFQWHSNQADFKKAIEDTILAVNTGKRISRSGHELREGKGKTSIKNKEWRSLLEEVERSLNRIKVLSDNDLQGRLAGPEIDAERDRIISLLNTAWTSLGLGGLQLPTAYASYSEVFRE